jgi:hypothetical protein
MQRTFLLTPSFWVSADPGEKCISRIVSTQYPSSFLYYYSNEYRDRHTRVKVSC